VANLGWLAVVRQEANEALATVDAIVNGTMVAGLGALGLASLVALFVARAISRPMVALGRTAEAIGAGNLDAPMPPAGADEIGRLTTSFANMNDRLRNLIGSLESRTAELSRANEELEREVSERRQAEEALAAKTKEYIDTLNLTGDIIIRADKRGRLTFLNDSACQSFGKPREELLDTAAATFVHPEDMEQATQAFRQITKDKGLVRAFESRIVTPMGTRVVEWNGYPFFDEEGEYTGIQITGRDITERKQMEDALRESDSRYHLIAENTRDLIWTMDLSLKYTYMSPAITRMRGYTVEEIMNSTAAETMTPASLEVARKTLAEEIAMESREDKDVQRSRKLELEMYCKDGSTIWTEMHMAFLRDQDGNPTGILGITRDISDRKKAEDALRESEERYRRLIEDSIDGIVVSEGSTIRFVNRAALRMFRYDSEEEIVGRPITDFISPEYRRLMAERNAARERGEPVPDRYEFKALRKDGSEFPAELSIGTVSHQGTILSQAIIRDMTERKQAEEELRTKDSAIESSINGIALASLKGDLTYVNPSLIQMWGYDHDSEILGRHIAEFWRDEEKARQVGRALRDRGSWIGELIAVRRDGSTFDVQVSVSMVTDEVGKPIRMMGSFVDITERKQMEEALQDSEERYRLIAQNAEDVIWTLDMHMHYTYVSPSVTRMRGYRPEELLGKRVRNSLTPASLEVARGALAEDLAIEETGQRDPFWSRTLELELNCKDGSTIWTEVKTTFLRDQDGKPIGILGVTRDISERKKAEEERERLNAELEMRAITDSLTGLYDHAHFYQRLNEEIERCKRYKHAFAVVMMDVDEFKRYNDSRGHQAGDEALRLIADCIRMGLRRSDIAFRYGGDEFAAILPHTDSSKARAVVERINGRIAKALQKMDGGAEVRLRMSCGVARFPDDGTTADDLVRIADAALYSAKWVARARDIMGQREDIQSLISALVSRRTGVEGEEVSEAFLRPEALHEHQARIVASVASSITVALKDAGVTQALEDPDLQVVATVGAAAEIKDRYIRGHPERTSEWSAALAQEMGLSAERVRDIRVAGILHDIGKVTVSEGILNKPGRLTKQEFASIKDHPIVGATLVSQVKGFERLVPIIRHHHEGFDGKGYPDRLAGEKIPLEARILSVVDAFDAMIHQRVYREALSTEEAIAELERGAGNQFDPKVVKAFVGLVERQGDELASLDRAASKDKQLAAPRPSARRNP